MSRKSAILRRCAKRWPAWAVAGSVLLSPLGQAAGQGVLPAGFVYLREIDPTIAQDMRYASSNNFVGRVLPGYEAAECVLRRDAAVALKQVQADLTGLGLGLKVYDCYRPIRAVRAMAQWTNDGESGGATRRFFPKLQKNNLFALGYIALQSAHSTGTAIDLTLVETSHGQAATFAPAGRYGPCTAPAAQRDPDNGVDMGTGFDCFDVASHTASPAISVEQRRWRTVLVRAMAARGFKNYHREWWHFAYARSGPALLYDFPIGRRAASARGNADR